MQRDRIGTVIGVGAWLKNRACAVDFSGGGLGDEQGPHITWSPEHGDLATPQACRQLDASMTELIDSARSPVTAIAHDLHPDFFSTQLAQRLASERGIRAIAVQHHHAHVAAVAAEHTLHRPVLGIALDGVGMGPDGMAWGGELLWVHGARWNRAGHLSLLSLPGADRAAREPWRVASAALHALGRGDQIPVRFAPHAGAALAEGVQRMLERDLRCPRTSSAGRWFDAAAAILGLVLEQDEEAQAAFALERAAARHLNDGHSIEEDLLDEALCSRMQVDAGVDMLPLFEVLLEPARTQTGTGRLAAVFHVHLAEALCDWSARAARMHDVREVCLSGGCFFNRILRRRGARGARLDAVPAGHQFLRRCGPCPRAGLDRRACNAGRSGRAPRIADGGKLMCLALPTRVVELRDHQQAVVELGGVRKEVSIALLDDVAVGDYVIVHVGHAIGKLDPEEAERTLALFAEMAGMQQDEMQQAEMPQATTGATR